MIALFVERLAMLLSKIIYSNAVKNKISKYEANSIL
jgi:hypothetical protein